jgi:hypothetical protein
MGKEILWLKSQKKHKGFCPKSQPQIQHSVTITDQMTISVSGPLSIIILIRWKLMKWICMLFLGNLAIGIEDDPMKLFLGNAMLFVGSIWKNKSG